MIAATPQAESFILKKSIFYGMLCYGHDNVTIGKDWRDATWIWLHSYKHMTSQSI